MVYHFGPNEYNYLIGSKIGIFLIKHIAFIPDNIYNNTDGQAGNGYLIIFENKETFSFRNFQEVVDKYGNLEIDKEK